MENATKALLIAGSVLIAILLIAMGMRIFNSTTETADAAQKTMDTTAVTTFNSKINPYLGNQSKSKAISLVNYIIASNASNDYKIDLTVVANAGAASYTGTNMSGAITTINNSTYSTWLIQSSNNGEGGRISHITIISMTN